MFGIFRKFFGKFFGKKVGDKVSEFVSYPVYDMAEESIYARKSAKALIRSKFMTSINISMLTLYIGFVVGIAGVIKFLFNQIFDVIDYINSIPSKSDNLKIFIDVLNSFGITSAFNDVFKFYFNPFCFLISALISKLIFKALKNFRDSVTSVNIARID